MQYKEMIEKTGMSIAGIVKSINEYISQKTGQSYWSVDLDVKGTRFPVNVKLPKNFDRSPIKEYELFQVRCHIRPGYGDRGIELHANAA